MSFGSHHLLYQSLPKWRDPRGRNGGSAKYTLRLITLAIVFVLLGLFASQLYVFSKDEPSKSSVTLETPPSTSRNRWTAHDSKHDDHVKQGQHDGAGSPPQAGLSGEDGPLLSPSASPEAHLDQHPSSPEILYDSRLNGETSKPWYWKVTSKFRSGHSAALAPTQQRPSHPSSPHLASSYLEDGSLPREDVNYPMYTHGERPYLGKVTVNVANSEDTDNHYERGLRTHVTQNKLHNYAMFILRYSLTSEKVQMWSKPAWLLSIILRELAKPPAERLQWLFWVDADTVVINPKVPVEAFLPPVEFNDIHILLTNDFNGLNNGIFPIRVCIWSIDFLSAVMAYTHYNPETHLQFHEQSAMTELLKHPKFSEHAVYVPQRWFNAYPGELNETSQPYQTKHGDMLVHFAGFGDKKERMSHWLQRAELHDPEWELEYRYTSYPNEVREFWGDVRRKGKDKKQEVERVQHEAQNLIEDVKVYLKEYKEDVDYTRRDSIKSATRALRTVLQKEAKKEDVDLIAGKVEGLKEAAEPLISRARKANHILYQEAHGVLLRIEEERNEMPDLPGAFEQDKELQTQLSTLRRLLIDNKANPRYLERVISAVNSARDHLKSRVEVVKNEMDAKKHGKENDGKEGHPGSDDLDEIDKETTKKEKEQREKAEKEAKEKLENEEKEKKGKDEPEKKVDEEKSDDDQVSDTNSEHKADEAEEEDRAEYAESFDELLGNQRQKN